MIAAAHEAMVREGLVTPVEIGGADERLFLDCDLASLAEHRLDDHTDPRRIDKALRATWAARATTERAWSLRKRSEYERCYWLLEDGDRVGTIAVSSATSLGLGFARIASFYVFPTHRGRGVGRRALDRMKDVIARYDLGIRLETSWAWQRTVRFYLRAGLWVYMWKRDLSLFWDAETPAPRIAVGDREATLSVTRGDAEIVLCRARRHGDALILDEPARGLDRDASLGVAHWHASSTLALALAMAGFPLIRSQAAWEDSYHADAGPPEALAYKITVWEAWDRDHGWRVETPRIPGLSYPTWGELKARWDRENAALEAKTKRG
ncbi:hypothetical protein A7982_13021 [Minicystis rosea]|nr:hypothetical protein A7982_13021 [Minicystis rosea]